MSTLNFGLRDSTASLTTWAPIWRAVFPVLKVSVNLKPVLQTLPPQASLNSAAALFLSNVYLGRLGS